MNPNDKSWIILRCSAANTLRLAQSLAWASIEAWSPSTIEAPRKGKSRSRRPKRVPLMGSFVFARAEHTADLIAIHEALSTPHPDFWLMRRHCGELAYIDDAELDPLRVAEQKTAPKAVARQWSNGEKVRCPTAGFEGLVGVVEGNRGKFVLVAFPGWPEPAKVNAALLLAEAA